jgi:hypothetical protein
VSNDDDDDLAGERLTKWGNLLSALAGLHPLQAEVTAALYGHKKPLHLEAQWFYMTILS